MRRIFPKTAARTSVVERVNTQESIPFTESSDGREELERPSRKSVSFSSPGTPFEALEDCCRPQVSCPVEHLPTEDQEQEDQRSSLIGSSRHSRFYRPCATWSDENPPPEVPSPRASIENCERTESGRRRAERGPLMRWLCWFCRPSNMIDPSRSSWLHKWDMLNTAQIAAISFLWPYETAFLDPQFDIFFAFNRMCDLFLVADMVMQFVIAYPDPLRPERAVRAPKAILMNYLKGWFFADFLSVLPVDFIYVMSMPSKGMEGSEGGSSIIGRLRFLRYFRAVRLLRLVRFFRLFERWNSSFGISNAKLTMLKLLMTLVLCCHTAACLWGGLAMAYEPNWLSALRAAKGGPDFPEDDTFSLYSLALYWAIITITSIGYGDITPQSMLEYHVASVCSSIMAIIWAYVIGAICGIVSTFDANEIAFKRTMDDLNWFMEDKDMPGTMRQRLRRYFYEAKEMNKQKVEQEVIKQMSPLLQGEVAMYMHHHWIGKVWYLRDMNREIIVWAARNLALAVFAPNEEVLDERTLFILQKGVCALKGKILVSGDIWGEDMLLSNPYLREQNKARALTHLSVLTLHIVDLFEVVVCFSEARARLRWAQIQIALMRGIIRIAKKVKAMKAKRNLDTWVMTEDKRVALYKEILNGNTGDEEDEAVLSGKTDYFDMTRRSLDRRSTSSVSNLEEATSSAMMATTSSEAYAAASPLQSEYGVKGTRSNAGSVNLHVEMAKMNQMLEEVKNMVRRNNFQGMDRTRSLNVDDVYLGPIDPKEHGSRLHVKDRVPTPHGGSRAARVTGPFKRMFG